MAESVLIVLAGVVMFASLFLILIPAVPVSALVWGIAMVTGALTGFTRFTPVAAIVATLLLAASLTSTLWLPLIGMRGRQISAWGYLAFFIGMIAGSVLIPIPFIGTILGGVIGVTLVEYMRVRQIGGAVQGGKSALRVILMTMISEVIFALLILITYIISAVATIP